MLITLKLKSIKYLGQPARYTSGTYRQQVLLQTTDGKYHLRSIQIRFAKHVPVQRISFNGKWWRVHQYKAELSRQPEYIIGFDPSTVNDRTVLVFIDALHQRILEKMSFVPGRLIEKHTSAGEVRLRNELWQEKMGFNRSKTYGTNIQQSKKTCSH